MVDEITLEVDREFLEGYRNYKIDEVLKEDNEYKVAYSLLGDFINKSAYNLNRLFEEMKENVGTIELRFGNLSIHKRYNAIGIDGIDDFDNMNTDLM